MMIPAIDLIDGEVVRLFQGDYQQKTNYQYTAKERQNVYAKAGATVMHFVDLDGAKDSNKRQLTLLETLVKHDTMIIQVGGGVRCKEDVQQLLNLGADRVVIGSLAIKEPDLVRTWITEFGGEKIVLALDVKIDAMGNKTLPTHGWIKDSGVNLETLLDDYIEAGLIHVLCTDISKDGTLTGSNVGMYQELCQQYPSIKWQASGGIGSLDDIKALIPTGVDGVILGRSLLEGKFTLEEAIACWPNA
ncbi:1-(5-phosphoribosyl)-5-[(5-phosphoribosylamino)methylideneamino]imidazole-4-carboxamide isomerase [Colwellia sp. 6M3]|jgi:phosphoribosylformimino-5-aminoimidazole carboxamide ribotide isomerase|uniref:1-(5-phosphoribosyl)-5-[(5- phosphoribosylamino)methylideneamino]imidazole-4- carboxamide isomerase n=1 Tax=Colwellia sp. 6M3 TaxID=2759849 RepID=UPI0015F5335E|nr:1-(5-phosphoribosyl)-5-[(5-phosphoribosylamino)methylideneamino]imidazole-4-carboxamide isomerase [Colwellia sp. 6M3]MBA6416018.1 1-(5-phosphoribosyl)-5-[(5-phosphoribosylamino)methylideneamino]imidazole-4-carboxamide isomerase [Colwellia sp. 6M3]|tara:strand:- start:380 stop:1117 length:738 start_codon:yes stop_codon:yes gene_type:complete